MFQIHEKTVAETLNRDMRPVLEKDVSQAVKDCDINNDGVITKEELNKWMVKYMKENEVAKEENKQVLLKKLTIKS